MEKNERAAVMLEDFPIIMEIVDQVKDPFKRACYRLANITLKLYGLRCMNYHIVMIKCIKSSCNFKLVFPYSSVIEKYLTYGRDAYLYLKNVNNLVIQDYIK